MIGIVALSGRVLEGESGYRAQRATIRKLAIRYLAHGPEFAIRDALTRRYKCDIVENDPGFSIYV